MRPKTVTVTVPAGVEVGQVLRLSQQGDEAAREGPPGDLLLVVTVQPHPRLRRDGLALATGR